MPIEREEIRINVGPWKLVFASIALVLTVLGGNYAMITVVLKSEVTTLIDDAITAHTSAPHPVTLERAEEIAKQVTQVDMDNKVQLAAKVAGIEIKQAGFSSDISWIKSHLVKQDEKLDKILAAQK
ncbi:MAG: hypothetical protein NXH95_13620 [Pseudomonadaceae bacterium]|nr:hypothetical protein [Pseudomonadaceae bacterium]